MNKGTYFRVVGCESCAMEQHCGLGNYLLRADAGGRPLRVGKARGREMLDSKVSDIEGMAEATDEIAFIPCVMMVAMRCHKPPHVLDSGGHISSGVHRYWRRVLRDFRQGCPDCEEP